MKRHICGAMVLLGAVLGSFCCAQASLLGIAGEYNIFMFDDIEQYGTDVEGRVAGGGDVTYGAADTVDASGQTVQRGFSIASKVQDKQGLADLVVGGNLTLSNGSVGYLTPNDTGGPNSQKGTILVGGEATFVPKADGTPSVGYDAATFQKNIGKSNLPIDFAAEQKYLTGLSGFWGGLSANGQTEVLYNLVNNVKDTYQITLTGSDPSLNVFTVNGSSIDGGLGFYINAPATSTILVNVTGDSIDLKNLGFYFNGIKGDQEGYPHASILFNFLTAQLINIDQIEVDGSLLAPWAHINFFKNSHIDGNLIAYSLFGEGEAHLALFKGNVPVPEPATWILLGGGLMGIAALRRRMKQ
jgi:choice-of-anchor A domain-containing protein